MISRSMTAAAFATVLATSSAGVALADVKIRTPGVDIRTPGGGVNVEVDLDQKLAPADAWIGREVYSIDGKPLGEVAAVGGDNVYLDMGGFLGLGESRVLLSSADIGSVTDERIVVRFTEADARNLPSTDAKRAHPR